MPTQTEDQQEQQARRPDQADQAEPSQTPVDPAKRRRGIITLSIVGVLLIAVCIVWWLRSRTYESTDDAQADAHLNPVAARVEGTVRNVYVEDNQAVQAGQPLVDLDTSDLEVKLAQARADYDQAVAQLNAESPNVPITQSSNSNDITSQQEEVRNAEASLSSASSDYESSVAKLRQAEANNEKSQTDLVRYKELLDKQEIAHADYDQYLATAKSQQANVNSAVAAAASSQKVIDQRRAQLAQQRSKLSQTSVNAPRQIEIKRANISSRKASVESYKAQLDQARLSVTYCHVIAPVSGIVMQRSAETGARNAAGTQLLVIAQINDTWITANFKETQLRKMHPGQHVRVKIDALGESFNGTVEAMPASTGDRASVLPAENATGNFVKVIQRLPVRIRLEKGQQNLDKIRPGMSVEPKVSLD
ncbi:HlyD family secretion protein [Granulicella arctica]|uniref:HlyD family secretion protein n=1 Tax=Granulicella arctica TaxID=940613 RepID=UPI0021DF52D3|nr:HlyD family secretion protein [Granulicella arctica]